jgi:ferredoxin-NADP reductase
LKFLLALAAQVFLLISGGIGVTPMQGIYNTLLLECEAGRKLRKVS